MSDQFEPPPTVGAPYPPNLDVAEKNDCIGRAGNHRGYEVHEFNWHPV
jgi:hypothetical protein